ncbi:hypothetical protein SADUNF_Sadunf02G0000200 [Salix dunnii]|uniref:Protein kinase domain-containing protein n=1 Tax=Salix dunnii TaxID=1413687 RepID=A0A835N598_9ROSI|nr:hypothetical protein SADUNF_Sadunf02G0000200 [Salix dunnii]
MVQWIKPKEHYFKLNVDGSFQGNSVVAGGGDRGIGRVWIEMDALSVINLVQNRCIGSWEVCYDTGCFGLLEVVAACDQLKFLGEKRIHIIGISNRCKAILVLRRTLEILTAAGSFGLKLLLDKRNGVFDQKKRKRAAELRRIFTRLGPTFVKLGQGLSTRPDICPPEYLEELAELQDALPTFPDAEAFSCIERELGLSLDSIFSSISPSPIAAASLGQVYKAQLTYSGQTVAVKVQRPGIEEAIGLDFYLIRGLGFFINKYVDIITSDVVALIDEFARREGQNARRFKKLYADREDILVPDIFWDYTSSKVLTMEWVDGVKLNEQDAIERQGLKVLDLVNTGIQCSLRQLLEYGYFHADPHPGNLLATPEGKLAFLDFGMMSETPEEARFAIIGHVVHMVNRDYEAMARDYYALDFLSRDVDVSPIVPALRNFFDDALNYTVSELNFKTLVNGLGAVFYQYPFNVPAYYALILRSLTVLEGLALYADPNFKVLAASYPYFAKRLLTDPNPYLRDALIELLFKDGRFRDFSANDALQPVLKLLLGPDGEELRILVIKEAVPYLISHHIYLYRSLLIHGFNLLVGLIIFKVDFLVNAIITNTKQKEENKKLKNLSSATSKKAAKIGNLQNSITIKSKMLTFECSTHDVPGSDREANLVFVVPEKKFEMLPLLQVLPLHHPQDRDDKLCAESFYTSRAVTFFLANKFKIVI